MDTKINVQNEEVLMKFGIGCIKKRIKKELEMLYKLYNDVTVSLYEKTFKVSICEITNKNKQKYEFIIPECYPFVCPQILYQGFPYIEFLKLNRTLTEYAVIKKITGQNCFCCHSLNCRDNWSPSTTIQKIIEEIHKIKNYKRLMIYKIIADKIKFKYLIEDIDLDSWLF
jgi:hypothetical protein